MDVAKPRQLVSPPTFTPLPYGLLSVVQRPAANDHWLNGVTYQSQCMINMGDSTYDECIAVTGTGSPPPPPAKNENIDLITRGATPFTPFAMFTCSPVGATTGAVQDRAEQALRQSAPWQVERAFWTGDAEGQEVVFPHLAADVQRLDDTGFLLQTIPVTGGSFDVADGLGFLEQQLGNCYNGVGVIHIPSRAFPTFDAWGLIERDGNQLRTLAGHLVAVGTGYPGTSPTGIAPEFATQMWIYATGAVFAYESDVFATELRESINRAENTVDWLAEKTYVLGWDCCHVGALIDIGVPVT